ncbi:MAG TPA: MFS transporter [Pyrinomonadaceae bacterium]
MNNTIALSLNPIAKARAGGYSLRRVIVASSVGTLIEWYDFFIFGSLAVTISPLFYPPGDETLALIAYVTTFAIGFVVRPFGALVFGRIGDLVGRKYTFLVTLLLMGGSTAAVGLLPTFQTIGYSAPVTLIALRVLQGLAIGGEYGGAVVYVAEHVPDNQRGFYTSFIQAAAPFGLFVSLAVIICVESSFKNIYGADAFISWGWRVPFLLSILLVVVSFYIRLRMRESPIFQHIKETGRSSSNPLREAFADRKNLKLVLVSLFGVIAGQGVASITSHIYSLFYLSSILKVNPHTARLVLAVAILLAIPSLIFIGWLSDRKGRKKFMMTGCLLAAVGFYPIYRGMAYVAGTNVVAVQSTPSPVTGEYKLTPVSPTTNPNSISTYKGAPVAPTKEVANPNIVSLILFTFCAMIPGCLVYGPLAAYLVEVFPTKIRYTSLSLPYHIGNGIFGGLVPSIGLISCAWTGNIYAGFVYPILVAALTFVVGTTMLPETRQHKIWDEVKE